MRFSEQIKATLASTPIQRWTDWRTQDAYSWERKYVWPHLTVGSVSMKRLREFASDGCNILEIPGCEVKYNHRQKNPICRFFHREIILGPGRKTLGDLLHEVAHLATMSRYHNLKWSTNYIKLLVELGDMDEQYLWETYKGKKNGAN